MFKEPPDDGGFFRVQGRFRVADGALDVNALLSATEAAHYAGKSVNVIVNWRNRGWLPVATDVNGCEIRDERGRPRYRLLDVAKAENATKRRGEQMARGITRRDPDQRIAA